MDLNVHRQDDPEMYEIASHLWDAIKKEASNVHKSIVIH